MRKLSAFVAPVLMAAAPALADVSGTITSQWTGSLLGQTLVRLSYPNVSGTGSSSIYTYSGMFKFQEQGATGTGSLVQTQGGYYYGFCVDLYESVSVGTTQYNVDDVQNLPYLGNASHPMGAAKANELRALFAGNYASLTDGTSDAVDQAAFQLAVWEIVYETSDTLNVSNGILAVTGGSSQAINNRANAMLAGMETDPAKWSALAGLWNPDLAGTDRSGQDFVSMMNGSFLPPAVPAPGAVALVACGLALVGWLKRRVA